MDAKVSSIWNSFYFKFKDIQLYFFYKKTQYSRKYDLSIFFYPLYQDKTVFFDEQKKQRERTNWFLRRNRLNIINNELESEQADIIILQDLITQGSGGLDSDINYLNENALSSYTNDLIKTYWDKEEDESYYFLSALKKNPAHQIKKGEILFISENFIISMNKIEMFKKDFFLYNVKIPDSKSEITENYNTLIKTIENSLIENRSIPTPYIIITGLLPGSKDERHFQLLLDKFNLVDTLTSDTDKIFTEDHQNEIYYESFSHKNKSRNVKILVDKNIIIQESSLALNKGLYPDKYLARILKHEKVWAGKHFAWKVTFNITHCLYNRAKK